MIPYADLRSQYRAIKPEIDAAVLRVLDSTQFILGEEVAAFEREFAAYCGAADAIGQRLGVPDLVTHANSAFVHGVGLALLAGAAALVGGGCLDAHPASVRARLEKLMRTHEITVTGCEICGDVNVQAHASSLPGRLVEWLCPQHHAEAHGSADSARQMALF